MTKNQLKSIVTLAAVLAAAILGFLLARDVVVSAEEARAKRSEGRPPRPMRQIDLPNPDRKAKPRHASKRPVRLEDVLFGVPKERVVRFKTDEAFRAFLAKLNNSDLRLLGQLDALRAARVGYDDLSDLDRLLGDDDDLSGNYLVTIPDLPQVDAQPGAVGFGRSTLEWLGISGDNTAWGEGVRIAMLDTGIGKHAALPEGVREIDLITGDGPPVDLHGHGTAVAALLVGSNTVSQGIAPSADLLSIRIADETGSSNSFLLAEGILRAVDEGAQVINISMGSYGDSSLVRDAVSYAQKHDVVIVAAAGNEGLDRPAYPAAYEGVISVGAIDSNGQRLDFSNKGENLSVGAPGYEILSAWPDDQFTSFSGTSAAAPIVAGTVAATMTELGRGRLSATAAAESVLQYTNAAGAPGADPEYGKGVIDVGRIMNSETPGIVDAAVASNWYEAPAPGEVVGTLLVTVENRGTSAIQGGRVQVTIGSNTFPMTVSSMQPGGTQVLSLPLNAPTASESISVQSVLTTNSADSKPSNNSLAGSIILLEPGSTGNDAGSALGGD